MVYKQYSWNLLKNVKRINWTKRRIQTQTKNNEKISNNLFLAKQKRKNLKKKKKKPYVDHDNKSQKWVTMGGMICKS